MVAAAAAAAVVVVVVVVVVVGKYYSTVLPSVVYLPSEAAQAIGNHTQEMVTRHQQEVGIVIFHPLWVIIGLPPLSPATL